MQAYEETLRQGGGTAVQAMCRFFMKDDPVHTTLNKITGRLTDLQIPHAVVGGMSLGAHGFVRATDDVDLLVTPENLKKLHAALDGLGFIPPFSGSKNLRDTETGVKVEFLITGGFPGDGKPKPVAFPNPEQCSIEINGIHYIKLSNLVELKLASGMTASNRIKDLADIQELIKALELDEDFASQLNPYVREKYLELWRAVRDGPVMEE